MKVLDALVDVSTELGVKIRFCPLRAIGRARGSALAGLSLPEWRAVRERFVLPAWTERGVLCFSVEENRDLDRCEGPDSGFEECGCSPYLTQMGIDPEGEAYPGGCTDDADKALSVGSITEHPLSTLWRRAQQDVVDRVLPAFTRCASCTPERIWKTWTGQLAGKPKRSRHLY